MLAPLTGTASDHVPALPISQRRNSTAAIEQAMEAMVLNRRQEDRLFNRDAEINSALEHIAAADKALTAGDIDAARKHLRGAHTDCITVFRDNQAERACEMAVPSLLTPSQSWTVRRAANETRPILGDLQHPFIGDRLRNERLAMLHAIFEVCPARVLRSIKGMRNELGVNKFSLLVELLAEWEAGRAPK